MRKILLSMVTASALAASIGFAAAETTTTTTTTWNDADGQMIQQYSTTNHYTSMSDPALQPSVGVQLPDTVTLYPLPDTINIPDRQIYSYSIINDHPVVVERSTRRVVHTW